MLLQMPTTVGSHDPKSRARNLVRRRRLGPGRDAFLVLGLAEGRARLAGDVLRAHGHLRQKLDGLHAALPDGRRRLALRREHLVEGEREGVPLLGERGVEGRLPGRHHRDDAEQRARAGDARGDAGSRGTARILLRQRPRGLRAVARDRDGGGDERRGFAHRARYTLVLASTRVPFRTDPQTICSVDGSPSDDYLRRKRRP